VALVTLLAYARSFDSAFQLDDNNHIVANPVLAHPTAAAILSFGCARVLPFATLVVNYHRSPSCRRSGSNTIGGVRTRARSTKAAGPAP
jgi:hypothetical protein